MACATGSPMWFLSLDQAPLCLACSGRSAVGALFAADSMRCEHLTTQLSIDTAEDYSSHQQPGYFR